MVDLITPHALSPGALNGKPPRSFGAGRQCACGTKIMQYRRGSICGLCEKDPDRAARVVASREEEQRMFGTGNRWKSKDYPDGCRECDEGDRFVRRHASGGLCSLHYQRARKEGRDVIEELRRSEAAARDEHRARSLDGHENGTVEPLLDQTESFPELDDLPQACCGDYAECDKPCVPRGKWLRDQELKIAQGQPENCPLEAGETCCYGTDADCGARDDDSTRPEPPLDERLIIEHCKALEAHLNVIEGISQTTATYLDLIDRGRETSKAAAEATYRLEELGISVELAPTALPVAPDELDGEVRSMKLALQALADLDRGAQLRVLAWVSGRYSLDRPMEG